MYISSFAFLKILINKNYSLFLLCTSNSIIDLGTSKQCGLMAQQDSYFQVILIISFMTSRQKPQIYSQDKNCDQSTYSNTYQAPEVDQQMQNKTMGIVLSEKVNFQEMEMSEIQRYSDNSLTNKSNFIIQISRNGNMSENNQEQSIFSQRRFEKIQTNQQIQESCLYNSILNHAFAQDSISDGYEDYQERNIQSFILPSEINENQSEEYSEQSEQEKDKLLVPENFSQISKIQVEQPENTSYSAFKRPRNYCDTTENLSEGSDCQNKLSKIRVNSNQLIKFNWNQRSHSSEKYADKSNNFEEYQMLDEEQEADNSKKQIQLLDRIINQLGSSSMI